MPLKLLLEGVVTVPDIPGVRVARTNTGHASWKTMYELLRSECYFLTWLPLFRRTSSSVCGVPARKLGEVGKLVESALTSRVFRGRKL